MILPSQLPGPQAAELQFAFEDHPTYCRECLKIRDLGGSKVPLELGAGQRKLSEEIARQKAAKRPVRIIVLKTRRSWFTTGACAEAFREVPQWPGRRGVVIANTYRPAGLEAFDYLKQFQQSYTPLERHGAQIILPQLIKDTEMEMKWDNGSTIEVLSAESGELRGGGRQVAVFDEVAFWRNAEMTLTGAMNMVPKEPGTMVLVLSTANGVGGEFYDLWQQANDPQSDTLFVPLFFGWLEHEAYRMPVPDPAALQATLDPEERRLMEMHNATLEQLQWRRVTIATECRGKVELFHQEYPTTAEEAFISSGRPALDLEALSRHPIIEPMNGDLRLFEEQTRRRLTWVPNPHGALSVWQKPQQGRRYVIGADPSHGRDVSETKLGRNPDYAVGFVADQGTGEQVAMLRARLRPGAFAEYLALLGIYYNYAYMNPEANDTGFIDALLRTGYPLELFYQRERDPSDRNPDQPEKLGFYTTALTRDWLINAADDAIRQMTITIHSAVVRSECQTFVVKPDGKREHMDNHHDDTVIALGLAELARRRAPRRPPTLGEIGGTRVVMYGEKARKARNGDDEDDD